MSVSFPFASEPERKQRIVYKRRAHICTTTTYSSEHVKEYTVFAKGKYWLY